MGFYSNNRIRFLLLLAVAVGILYLTANAYAASAETPVDRPNILFIFSDDHAYQAVSAYGYGYNQTPNIDRIGQKGMLFKRCLVTNAICGPSRATVLTGKYSHSNHFYNHFHSVFDGTQSTAPKLLREAGYTTAIVGKWHLVSDPTGFDYWDILPGQGQYYNPPMISNGETITRQGYVTDIITDLALKWLKDGRDKSKPFLLMVHHKAPHREWEPALKHLTLFDGVEFRAPETLFDDYSGRGKAEHDQEMMIGKNLNERDLKLTPPPTMDADQRKVWDSYYNPRNEEFRKRNLQGKDLVRWKFQRYMHDYLATIASVDESVGRLLEYLAVSGLDKNTLVIYSSDQGFYLGEHGWFDKRWIFEESLKAPLLVRWPNKIKPGTVSNEIVSNVDFAETFLDLAGAPVPPEMQGRSLSPLLTGASVPEWRKAFYYHYYEHPGDHNVPRHYGVVTDRYKLVHFYEPDTNYWELFNLEKDPHELKNVYNQPAYAETQTTLHKELKRLRDDLKVPDPDPEESIVGFPTQPHSSPINQQPGSGGG